MFIKITATESSSAMRNTAELKETLLKKYGTVEFMPRIVILYMDGRPEHRTNFLLYHSLNVDMILHLQTTPGH